MDDLNSPADYQWRCPCIGMPCDTVRFDRIQDLILHMETEHYLSVVICKWRGCARTMPSPSRRSRESLATILQVEWIVTNVRLGSWVEIHTYVLEYGTQCITIRHPIIGPGTRQTKQGNWVWNVKHVLLYSHLVLFPLIRSKVNF